MHFGDSFSTKDKLVGELIGDDFSTKD